MPPRHNPVGNWPQFITRAEPPSPQPQSPSPAVTPTPAPLFPTMLRPSYTEQLRQASAAQAAPYVTLLREAPEVEPALPEDRPLREALIQILASILATGRDRVSSRDLHWRLRVPPQLANRKGRDIARVMRSLGWVRSHYGTDRDKGGIRTWGWVWREWTISARYLSTSPRTPPSQSFDAIVRQ
jgi:hypothetical protein